MRGAGGRETDARAPVRSSSSVATDDVAIGEAVAGHQAADVDGDCLGVLLRSGRRLSRSLGARPRVWRICTHVYYLPGAGVKEGAREAGVAAKSRKAKA